MSEFEEAYKKTLKENTQLHAQVSYWNKSFLKASERIVDLTEIILKKNDQISILEDELDKLKTGKTKIGEPLKVQSLSEGSGTRP